LRESFQENLLRCVFNQIALAKEALRHVEHSRTIAPDYLSERRLVFSACLARQLEVRRLFVPVRQKAFLIRSYGRRARYELRYLVPPVRGETSLVIALFTFAMAFAFASFELRFPLFKLGLLLSSQNGLHFLMKLEFLAHQLGLQARHFR